MAFVGSTADWGGLVLFFNWSARGYEVFESVLLLLAIDWLECLLFTIIAFLENTFYKNIAQRSSLQVLFPTFNWRFSQIRRLPSFPHKLLKVRTSWRLSCMLFKILFKILGLMRNKILQYTFTLSISFNAFFFLSLWNWSFKSAVSFQGLGC